MNGFLSHKRLCASVVVPLLVVGFVSVNSTRADWDPTTPNTKWVQMPDLLYGMDVRASEGKILADDFLCTFSGPITDIHIWGSWLNDVHGTITNLHVSFHADIPDPDGTGPLWSMPGELLWQTNFLAGQFFERFWTNASEVFYDPNINQIIGTDTEVWQYNMFVDPDKAFVQQQGNIYWLDVTAYTSNGLFGWKTSLDHFNDDAVFDDLPQVPVNWREMRYPPGHPFQGESIDLAFALTTIPEPATFVLVGFSLLGVRLLARQRRVR